MIRFCIILTIATIIAGYSWVLWGDRSGNEFIKFIDGHTHGVTRWWYIKGLFDQLLLCVYCFTASLIAMRFIRPMAIFFWILFLYHAAGLVVWMYDYSTNRYVFYCMLAAVIVFTVWKCWPRRGKLRRV